MNDETQELLHRLEQATSRSQIDCGRLDEETATMRESWLTLGRLLQSSDRQPQEPAVTLREPVAASRRTRLWVWSCVASVVAIALIWTCLPKSASKIDSPQAANPGLTSPIQQPLASDGADDAMGVAWDDGWDLDFSQSALALQRIYSEQQLPDAALSRLESDFSELAQEFESGSL